MLFAAGMGIGLVFWGTAEPLAHFASPPSNITPDSGEAAAFAMKYSFFHWGLHPWAIYAIMSLSLAYFSYRRNMPPLLSSAFYPLLGEKINGAPGHLINILGVFATVFGVATSLGLGALQISSGLQKLYNIPEGITTILIIIVIATVLYITSSVLGLDKGILKLSKLNMYLAFILMAAVFMIGPTLVIVNIFFSTLGDYSNSLLEMSLQTFPFQGYDWVQSWTLFYWAWWIAWSPFVGMLVARISRGRTIRQFVLGVLIAPSLFNFIWFTIFGGTALNMELTQSLGLSAVAVQDYSMVIFAMLEHLPLGSILTLLTVILVIIFFVTSADSATFVLGIMTSQGNMNPSQVIKVSWGLMQSSTAAILIFSGGLIALQKMSITAALPLTFIMLIMCYSLLRALASEQLLKKP
ncbi:MAG: BCCT family transporter, partial [Syntrophomonadaceae bacterium]|nr:BCCT family transporter [Syntrophomonadaceae bacterium]